MSRSVEAKPIPEYELPPQLPQESSEVKRGLSLPQDFQKNFSSLFDHFEAAAIMDTTFNPRQISTGEAPDFVLKDFEALSKKYAVKTIDELFDVIQRKITEFKKEHQNEQLDPANQEVFDQLKKFDKTRDLWFIKMTTFDSRKRTESRVRAKERAEKKAEYFNKLVADINSGKFTAIEALDLSPEQRQELLAYASGLAQEETGTAGADFYEKLNALGLTPKTARVSEVAAHFKERASQRETLPQVGTGSVVRETRSNIPRAREEAPESKVNGVKGELLEVPQVKQEGMWKNFWRSLTRNYGGPGQKAYDTAMFGAEPTGGKQPGFLRRFWDRLGGVSEEEAAAKIDRQAEKAAKQKYRPLVRELKKFGTSFSEASRFAGISEKETELAINILMGKVVTLDEQQERLVKSSLSKIHTFSAEQPQNKARSLLLKLYEAAAQEVNLFGGISRKKAGARRAVNRGLSDLDRGADAAGRAGQSR